MRTAVVVPEVKIPCRTLKKFTTCDGTFYPGDQADLSPILATRMVQNEIVCRIKQLSSDPVAPLEGSLR